MKKIKFLIPTLIMAVLLTGCGKSPEEVLKDASLKMNELENYHMTMNMEMEMSAEGTSMTIGAKVESDIDEKNGVGVMDTTASFMGMTSTEKSYMTYKDGKQKTYTQEEDTWYYEESDYEETIDFDMFGDLSSIEELEDEKGTYKISLSEEQIKEIMSSVEDTEDAEIDLSSVSIKVTVDDDYITKMVMEMPMSMSEEDTTINMNVTITFEFSKFNEVTNVVIPNDVLANAKDIKVLEIEQYANDYIYEIEWDVYDQNVTKYNNTDLEYDGPKPTLVDLKIEEGYVTDGVIEINGYTATITDGVVTDVTKTN